MKIEFQSLDKDNLFPPVPATQVIPDRFKQIPSTNENYMTVKHCMPMIEHLSSGYALRLRNDIEVIQNGNTFKETFGKNGLAKHPHAQLPMKLYHREGDYLKLPNTWVVKTPDGYSSMFYPVFGEERFKIFSGIVATDKYSSPVFIPGAITTDENFIIRAGTPIAIVFPFKREEWKSEVLDWTPEARMSYVEEQTSFLEVDHFYKTHIHTKSKYT